MTHDPPFFGRKFNIDLTFSPSRENFYFRRAVYC